MEVVGATAGDKVSGIKGRDEGWSIAHVYCTRESGCLCTVSFSRTLCLVDRW